MLLESLNIPLKRNCTQTKSEHALFCALSHYINTVFDSVLKQIVWETQNDIAQQLLSYWSKH